MRTAALAIVAATTLGACSFKAYAPAPEPSPAQQLERSEEARARQARAHPDCRSDRTDRDDRARSCRPMLGGERS